MSDINEPIAGKNQKGKLQTPTTFSDKMAPRFPIARGAMMASTPTIRTEKIKLTSSASAGHEPQQQNQ